MIFHFFIQLIYLLIFRFWCTTNNLTLNATKHVTRSSYVFHLLFVLPACIRGLVLSNTDCVWASKPIVAHGGQRCLVVSNNISYSV